MGEDRINGDQKKADVFGVVGKKIHPQDGIIKRTVEQKPHRLGIKRQVPVIITKSEILPGQEEAPAQEGRSADRKSPAIMDLPAEMPIRYLLG